MRESYCVFNLNKAINSPINMNQRAGTSTLGPSRTSTKMAQGLPQPNMPAYMNGRYVIETGMGGPPACILQDAEIVNLRPDEQAKMNQLQGIFAAAFVLENSTNAMNNPEWMNVKVKRADDPSLTDEEKNTGYIVNGFLYKASDVLLDHAIARHPQDKTFSSMWVYHNTLSPQVAANTGKYEWRSGDKNFTVNLPIRTETQDYDAVTIENKVADQYGGNTYRVRDNPTHVIPQEIRNSNDRYALKNG